MRRVLLITVGSLLVLCVICLGLGYFVVRPRVQDAFADEFQHSMGTVVAGKIAAPPIAPGTYTLTDAELTAALKGDVKSKNGASIDNIAARILPDRIQIVLDSNSGDATFDLKVAAENGKFVVNDVSMSDSWLRFLIPKDKLKSAVEKGVNQAVASKNLVISDLTLEQGRLTLVTAPGSTAS